MRVSCVTGMISSSTGRRIACFTATQMFGMDVFECQYMLAEDEQRVLGFVRYNVLECTDGITESIKDQGAGFVSLTSS
jgi:hypothetical protein